MSHILFMDDELELALSMRELLEGCGHTFEWARSASDALDYLKHHDVDLLITDIYIYQDGRLVQDGGISLIGRVRMNGLGETEIKLPRDIPIIAISGGVRRPGNPHILGLAAGMGANYTLAKPISNQDMLATVNAALHHGHG